MSNVDCDPNNLATFREEEKKLSDENQAESTGTISWKIGLKPSPPCPKYLLLQASQQLNSVVQKRIPHWKTRLESCNSRAADSHWRATNGSNITKY